MAIKKKGKYPKKPKLPKKAASLSVWENFETRLKEYVAKCKDIDAAFAKVEADKKKKENLIVSVTKKHKEEYKPRKKK